MGVYFYSLSKTKKSVQGQEIHLFPFRFKFAWGSRRQKMFRERLTESANAVFVENNTLAVFGDKLEPGQVIYRLTRATWVDTDAFPGEPVAFLDKVDGRWQVRYHGVLASRLTSFTLPTRVGVWTVNLSVPGRATDTFSSSFTNKSKVITTYETAAVADVLPDQQADLYAGFIEWRNGAFHCRLTDGQERRCSSSWPQELPRQAWDDYAQCLEGRLACAANYFRKLHEDRERLQAEQEEERKKRRLAATQRLAEIEAEKRELLATLARV